MCLLGLCCSNNNIKFYFCSFFAIDAGNAYFNIICIINININILGDPAPILEDFPERWFNSVVAGTLYLLDAADLVIFSL